MSESPTKQWRLNPSVAWGLGAGLLVGGRGLRERPSLYLAFGLPGLLLLLYGFGLSQHISNQVTPNAASVSPETSNANERWKRFRSRLPTQAWLLRNCWPWPLAIYLLLAIRGLLLVPCTLLTRRAYGRFPGETEGMNLWLWQVQEQTIRYSLVAYNEIVLLVLVLTLYAVLYATSESVRCSVKTFLRR